MYCNFEIIDFVEQKSEEEYTAYAVDMCSCNEQGYFSLYQISVEDGVIKECIKMGECNHRMLSLITQDKYF